MADSKIYWTKEKGIWSYRKNEKEKVILELYLPKQLTPSEIETFVQDYVRDGGKPAAMKALKENYAGQYDGKVASTVIDNLILCWSVWNTK